MKTDRILAAKRLAETLRTNDDLDWFVLDHPNETRALARLAADLGFRLKSPRITGRVHVDNFAENDDDPRV